MNACAECGAKATRKYRGRVLCYEHLPPSFKKSRAGEIRRGETLSVGISIRKDDMDVIEEAMSKCGENRSEFLVKAAMMRIRGELGGSHLSLHEKRLIVEAVSDVLDSM